MNANGTDVVAVASPAPAPARKLKYWILGLAGLAFLYVLSAGPALFLAQRRAISTDLVVAVYFSPYAPLQMAMDLIPGADVIVKTYVGFWESLTPMPPPN